MAIGIPQVIIMIASYAVSYLNRPKPVSPKPAAFEDLELPTAELGTAQYVIFGDCWIKDPVVLEYGNFRTTKIVTKGGKKSIGGWTPGLVAGTTNPIEAALGLSPPDPLHEKIATWDPSYQPDPPDTGLGGSLVGGSTWIP